MQPLKSTGFHGVDSSAQAGSSQSASTSDTKGVEKPKLNELAQAFAYLKDQLAGAKTFQDVELLYESLVDELLDDFDQTTVNLIMDHNIYGAGGGEGEDPVVLIDEGGANILVDHLIEQGKLPADKVHVCGTLEDFSRALIQLATSKYEGKMALYVLSGQRETHDEDDRSPHWTPVMIEKKGDAIKFSIRDSTGTGVDTVWGKNDPDFALYQSQKFDDLYNRNNYPFQIYSRIQELFNPELREAPQPSALTESALEAHEESSDPGFDLEIIDDIESDSEETGSVVFHEDDDAGSVVFHDDDDEGSVVIDGAANEEPDFAAAFDAKEERAPTVHEEFERVFEESGTTQAEFDRFLAEDRPQVSIFMAEPQRQFDDNTCAVHATHDIQQFFRTDDYFEGMEHYAETDPGVVDQHPHDPQLFMVKYLRPTDMKLLQSKTAQRVYRVETPYPKEDVQAMERSIKKSNRAMVNEKNKMRNSKALYRAMKYLNVIKHKIKTEDHATLEQLAHKHSSSKLRLFKK